MNRTTNNKKAGRTIVTLFLSCLFPFFIQAQTDYKVEKILPVRAAYEISTYWNVLFASSIFRITPNYGAITIEQFQINTQGQTVLKERIYMDKHKKVPEGLVYINGDWSNFTYMLIFLDSGEIGLTVRDCVECCLMFKEIIKL